ncbi:MAG: phage tail sheath C-terminal domain-containing protein [Acetobacteraceae bacterium]
MPFPELLLRQAPPPGQGLSSRADVALFVGLVPRRTGVAVPDDLRAWLQAAGWAGSGPFARSGAQVDALLDIPVPVDDWAAFERLFAWDQRIVRPGGPGRIPCALGLAVRSFFEAGGVRAYIVRTGDPLPLLPGAPAAAVIAHKHRVIDWSPGAPPPGAAHRVPLIPGSGPGSPPQATDPATWRGVAHVWGVEEAAMLSLPDLPELCSGPPMPLPAIPAPPPVAEQFKPCAPPVPGYEPPEQVNRLAIAAPRLDRGDYRAWAGAIRHVLGMLSVPQGSAHRRDVMLVASLPLPSFAPGAVPNQTESWPFAILDRIGVPAPGQRLLNLDQIGSARLQLAYPWIETAASAGLPEGVEGAEGVLMGTIARTSLSVGAFRSAAGSDLPSVRRALPELGTAALRRGLEGGRADWLGDRLCLIGRRVGGFTLLSDSTMAASRAWRAGGVSRLMGIILRASRFLGQDRLFEPAGETFWNAIRLDLESFLERLRQAGALDGATVDQAYTVRCDRTTMTQADIDAGRTIVSIGFTAAQPIERITVTLALGQSGGVTMREAA